MAVSNRIGYLKKLYYDVDRQSGLSSIEQLYRTVKKEGKYDLTRKQI